MFYELLVKSQLRNDFGALELLCVNLFWHGIKKRIDCLLLVPFSVAHYVATKNILFKSFKTYLKFLNSEGK